MSKIVIRKGVFETNSSSVHAISIVEGSKRDIPGRVFFPAGQFGWEQDNHSDLETKASYLWTAILTCFGETEAYNKAEEIAGVLKAHGVSEVEFQNPRINDYWYVDHGSELLDFVNTVLEREDLLLDYLFGTSMVSTGNDNGEEDGPHCLPEASYVFWK